MFKPGDCLHIVTGEDCGYTQFHRFIILTRPDPETGSIILVNFSTIHPGGWYDDTVVCRAKDHHFLESDSFIDYSYARIETVESLEAMIEANDAKWAGHRIEGQLLHQIQYGIEDSGHTPFDVLAAFNEYKGTLT